MKSSYYIVVLRQQGNIGTNEVFKIVDQPEEGFKTEKHAEKHLKTNKKAIMKRFHHWVSFSILKLYEFEKD